MPESLLEEVSAFVRGRVAWLLVGMEGRERFEEKSED